MGYLKIPNLDIKHQEILLFKQAYVLQKIDGTSCHISWDGNKLSFFSGCINQLIFELLFDKEKLLNRFKERFGIIPVIIYGEGYGGKVQGMSKRYGQNTRFVAFDVKINESWLNVPDAEEIVLSFGLDFVPYKKIDVSMEELDRCRDEDSIQSIKNGLGPGIKTEGIVCRPLIEMLLNSGKRIICKHKREENTERKTKVINGEENIVVEYAKKIAGEWVTAGRLHNLLSKNNWDSITHTPFVIKAMLEDIKVEAEDEIVWNKELNKHISHYTVVLWKDYLKQELRDKFH